MWCSPVTHLHSLLSSSSLLLAIRLKARILEQRIQQPCKRNRKERAKCNQLFTCFPVSFSVVQLDSVNFLGYSCTHWDRCSTLSLFSLFGREEVTLHYRWTYFTCHRRVQMLNHVSLHCNFQIQRYRVFVEQHCPVELSEMIEMTYNDLE